MTTRWMLAFALGGALVLSGCGRSRSADAEKHDHAKDDAGEHAHEHDATPQDEEGHEHEHGGKEGATARFEEGHGLELAPETATAIGLTTAKAERRSLAVTTEITATVFDAGPPARASTLVPVAVAESFTADPRVIATHRDTLNALGQVELVVAAPDRAVVGTTLALELRAPSRDTLSVPNSAVLRTATGNFVYVRHGEHWVRTAVTTGATDGGFTAIADGLAVGDIVAATAVEHLWLTELRLTKGGGHSH